MISYDVFHTLRVIRGLGIRPCIVNGTLCGGDKKARTLPPSVQNCGALFSAGLIRTLSVILAHANTSLLKNNTVLPLVLLDSVSLVAHLTL